MKVQKFMAQVEQATLPREMAQLAEELQAVKSTKPVDYKRVSQLMKRWKTLEAGAEMSEEDCVSLPARHAALVQQMEGMYEELVEARRLDLMLDLEDQLKALKALDLTAPFTSPGDNDPVYAETTVIQANMAQPDQDNETNTAQQPHDHTAAERGGLEVDAEDAGPSARDPVWVKTPTASSTTTTLSIERSGAGTGVAAAGLGGLEVDAEDAGPSARDPVWVKTPTASSTASTMSIERSGAGTSVAAAELGGLEVDAKDAGPSARDPVWVKTPTTTSTTALTVARRANAEGLADKVVGITAST
jgi:hypothetical protein